ncbi:ribonuclease T2-like [Onygenales sp. PD_40]|nr:ribonuclease T2-like [Onygenales sp. PD_40]
MVQQALWGALGAVARPLKDTLPSPKSVLHLAFGASQIPLWNSNSGPNEAPQPFQSCPRPELSCSVDVGSQNTCCFNYPGGLFLQTQFWDADPPTGPVDGWTIHGLWPDHCDGTFDQYCDSSRRLNNITSVIEESGRVDLLNLMQTHWKDFRGDDENLWVHEWNKHGTCISTLKPRCYPNYVENQEVVAYFKKAVDLFLGLPSYKTLADVGITPSEADTYDRDAIESALRAAHGVDVSVRCRNGALNEIWYFFNVAGPLESGKFVPARPADGTSNCPRSGIRYKPKNSPGRNPPKSPTKPNPEPTEPPSGTPFAGRGQLMVQYSGRHHGCIISRGYWFTSGTCATFHTVAHSDGFFLRSSKGLCSFDDGAFTCSHDIKEPTEFREIDGKLSLDGNTIFYADAAPRKRTQKSIFDSEGDHPLSVELYWQGV